MIYLATPDNGNASPMKTPDPITDLASSVASTADYLLRHVQRKSRVTHTFRTLRSLIKHVCAFQNAYPSHDRNYAIDFVNSMALSAVGPVDYKAYQSEGTVFVCGNFRIDDLRKRFILVDQPETILAVTGGENAKDC